MAWRAPAPTVSSGAGRRTQAGKEVVMAEDQDTQAMPPGPDPALERLERFVGSWKATGRTLDSKEDNVSGRLEFEWLPGGFFLQQRSEFNFAGYEVKGVEIIGYDPATDRFPSTVFPSMLGVPIAYEWDVHGDQVTIRTELNGGATYTGTFSEDDNWSGGWRPDPGAGPGNVAYDITATRAS
jgi:hypothetical protein